MTFFNTSKPFPGELHDLIWKYVSPRRIMPTIDLTPVLNQRNCYDRLRMLYWKKSFDAPYIALYLSGSTETFSRDFSVDIFEREFPSLLMSKRKDTYPFYSKESRENISQQLARLRGAAFACFQDLVLRESGQKTLSSNEAICKAIEKASPLLLWLMHSFDSGAIGEHASIAQLPKKAIEQKFLRELRQRNLVYKDDISCSWEQLKKCISSNNIVKTVNKETTL